MNLGLKVALKNLTEVVSAHAPNAVWATEEAKKQVFEAISIATASLTVSAVRKSKKVEKLAALKQAAGITAPQSAPSASTATSTGVTPTASVA